MVELNAVMNDGELLRRTGTVLDGVSYTELFDLLVALGLATQAQVDAIVAGAGNLPVGGTIGQVAAKASNIDFDVEWIDPSAGGGAVDSVNGQTGAVVLNATHVSADPAGTAASQVATHSADTTSVHGITDTAALYRAGGTDVPIADGGTGASTAAAARTSLDVYSKAEVDALLSNFVIAGTWTGAAWQDLQGNALGTLDPARMYILMSTDDPTTSDPPGQTLALWFGTDT